MEGTIKNGEYLEVTESESIDYGDIIAFEHIDQSQNEATWIFRVIGKAGDSVEIINGQVFVNKQYTKHIDHLKFSYRLNTKKALSEDVLDMYPIELSGGMKQRMVMVLSTLLDPSLLIADEITSALDVSSQKAVAELLVEFRDRKFVNSVIFITHDISILYQIADSITVMYAGQLAEKAPTEVIMESPRHPYTRMLISSLPKVGVKYSEEKLKGIPGHPPGLLNPPRGCRFQSRCPLAHDRCVEEPPFLEIEEGHYVACWAVFAEEEEQSVSVGNEQYAKA